MTSSFQIALRAGDRIYINGAVLRVDRKVRIELLNNATFLLGAHVMQLEDATTPIRQLYFIVQGQLMDPSVAPALRPAIDEAIEGMCRESCDSGFIEGLRKVSHLIAEGSTFEALRAVRQLVALEDERVRGGGAGNLSAA